MIRNIMKLHDTKSTKITYFNEIEKGKITNLFLIWCWKDGIVVLELLYHNESTRNHDYDMMLSGLNVTERKNESEWYEGLTDGQIRSLKRNRTALIFLEEIPHLEWMANTFRAMPFKDLVYLDGSGDWLPVECPAEDFLGTVYRLREDWQRPQTLEEWLDAEIGADIKNARKEARNSYDKGCFIGSCEMGKCVKAELKCRNII